MTCVGMKTKMRAHSPVAISASHSTQSCLENVTLLTVIFFSSHDFSSQFIFPSASGNKWVFLLQ